MEAWPKLYRNECLISCKHSRLHRKDSPQKINSKNSRLIIGLGLEWEQPKAVVRLFLSTYRFKSSIPRPALIGLSMAAYLILHLNFAA